MTQTETPQKPAQTEPVTKQKIDKYLFKLLDDESIIVWKGLKQLIVE